MIRFAILGCGTVGRIHAEAIRKVDDAMLVGFCDYDPARTEQYAKAYGVRAYPSFEELLADKEIDAISICTPSGLHPDQAIQALKGGKHVLVEKPMALNSRDALRVLEAANASSCLLGTVFQTRYANDVQYLKKVLERGELGRIVLCDLYMKFWRESTYYSMSPWRGTFAMDGGALMNQGIHGLDLVNYLMGTPKILGAKVKTMVHDIEAEDTATALVEYPSGALGVIEAATSTPPGSERTLEIHGSRGYATIVNTQLTKLYIDGKYLINEEPALMPGTSSDPSSLSCSAHIPQYENFVGALKGRNTLLSDARDGYAAVKLIEDIYASSEKN